MRTALTSIVAACCLISSVARADAIKDATKDLWATLKAGKDVEALAAIAKGVDVNTQDPLLGTPLNLAACFAGPDVVKALIAAKSNVNNVAPANRFTPLLNALTWGNVPAVKVLLAAGASPAATHPYGDALMQALTSTKIELVRLVLDAGVSPSRPMKIGAIELNGMSFFIARTLAPKDKVARFVAEKEILAKMGIAMPAWMSAQQEADFTPLEDITRLLIEKGANPNQPHPTEGSILFSAAAIGKTGIVKALIDAKAKLETTGYASGPLSGHQITPVMVAAAKGHNEIVELLLKAGAAVNTRSVQSRLDSSSLAGTTTQTKTYVTNTAVSLASEAGHPDTVALLRKYGGKGPTE